MSYSVISNKSKENYSKDPTYWYRSIWVYTVNPDHTALSEQYAPVRSPEMYILYFIIVTAM